MTRRRVPRSSTGGPQRPDEGSGRLQRRALLRHGLALAGAGAAMGGARANDATEDPARPSWMKTPGAPFSPYGQPAPEELALTRRIAANRMLPGNGASFTPIEELEGIVTPNGLHFERHHNGVPHIDPTQHQLLIHGLVRQALRFDIDSLLRYPMRSQLLFIECGGNSNAGWHPEPIQRRAGSVHGLVSCSEWTGVPLNLLLDEAGLPPGAAWGIAEGADAFAMHISLPIDRLRQDAIVALYQNGERLRPAQGYPLRLIVPGCEGVLNVKWLHRLHIAEQPVMARNETAKYTELQPDGRARQFTHVMEVKSLITSPSHGQRLRGPQIYPITGLAWSGRGRIARVDISTDGGRHWVPARLDAPVLPHCLTRFRADWRWDGTPTVLKSRAVDESGAVQPERAALVQARGTNGYFHYNAIVAWSIEADGSVRHVYA